MHFAIKSFTICTMPREQRRSLAKDVRGEIKAAQKLPMPGWGVVCGIIASFLCAQLFDHFGKLDLVLPTLNCILVLGFVLVLKRKQWGHAWFWVTMAVIAAFHVLLVLFVPWTSRWIPALAIAAIDSVNFCLILWILAFVGKLVKGPKAAESSTSSRVMGE